MQATQSKKRVYTNRVQGYLIPKNKTLFDAYIKAEELTESEGINDILTAYFKSLQPEKKQAYLNKAEYPNKVSATWPV